MASHFSRRRGIEGGRSGLGLSLFALSTRPAPDHHPARSARVISLLSLVISWPSLAGVSYAFVAVPAQVQLQEELPEQIRGRVFGVLNMLVSIASFLPIIIVGPIADVVGTSLVVMASAIVALLLAVGSVLRAHPGPERPGHSGLIDAADPVALAGRSLTQPVMLAHGAEGHEHELGDEFFATAVIPGRPGRPIPPKSPTER